MFQQACGLYRHVAAVTLEAQDKWTFNRTGSGCMLADSLVLTARHVVWDSAQAGRAVLVRCQTGLWLSRLVWEDEPADLAMLVLTTCVERDGPPPTLYPRFHDSLPYLGMSLGYIARHDTKEKESGLVHQELAFFAGFVSRREPDFKGYPRFRLADSYAIGGFSGAPVFLPAPPHNLVAVHSQSSDLWVTLDPDKEDSKVVGFVFPEVTPVLPALPLIQRAMQTANDGS